MSSIQRQADGSDVDATDGETSDTEDEYTFEDVSVVMGTYNEEAAIATVIDDVEAVTDGKAEIVCVDGSSDRTPEIAREKGARVIEQEPQGYGVAVREAILAPDRPIVVTTDCDDTYPMEQLPEFLAAINDGADVVSGDRLYHGAEAMPAFNRFGNQAFAAIASVLMSERVHDTTTGMRAYRREVVESIEWTENTGLSAELLIRPLMRGYEIREQPIAYRERAGETKLDPIEGGLAIAKSIVTVCLEERFR
ncbi:MAG: dolichyl-phosphate hexose transferase [Natronomonas sp.]|jgi:glycosyltransferase involved in cell wall biosynthesis|uniref:Glycosyltransferase family 2 protein n=2 Tax=Natronomonas salsuginis TaxID=2217661 RepID=A0A4U5J8D6_9EURY|nr:dolichyl-phosphate hexose transferase [Natronomonas salsuginis]MDR9380394.1 dolichyl-phosphate hexose transferase [Natronomonas sp.]TKR24451.1 glycosyltransferase family 2 protein [Natronomonas salsuginis]